MRDIGFRPGQFIETSGTKVLAAGLSEWRNTLLAAQGGVLLLDEA